MEKNKRLLRAMRAALFAGTACVASAAALSADAEAEEVNIAIISFSPYAPWYIAQEKGLTGDLEINVRVIEDITAKNAALASGDIQCMLNTMDSIVVARSADVPIKVVAVADMSYGLDEMVVDESIQSVEDFPGKQFGADYAFLNHMWMLLTLKKAGIPLDALTHSIMLPQDSAAAFASGGLDIDVNYRPFSTQSLERPGAHLLKSSFTDRTWERGLISDVIACNETWLAENPDTARKMLDVWFAAIDWWKQNPEEGNAIIAEKLDWAIEDVQLSQYGAIMLNLSQNLGAFGTEAGAPVCASLPNGAPTPPAEPSGWGELLFDGRPDCEAGYLPATWDLFGEVYMEAGVIENTASAAEGLDSTALEALAADGALDRYTSNDWIGRVGP